MKNESCILKCYFKALFESNYVRMFFVIVALAFMMTRVIAQDSTKKKLFGDVITGRGYVKYMQTSTFPSLDTITGDNLIHNRLNFKAYVSPKVTAAVEMRNRIIYGDQVFAIQGYGDILEYDRGLLDMNWTWLNKQSVVGHTMVDRLYLNYAADKWEARIGRQRINWGIATAWNPNDLFNAYNFIDFDYEERPGSDAVRFQYYLPDGMSQLEFAASTTKDGETVAAAIYKFNKWNYDFQLIGGQYYDDVTLGVGWAGNIKKAGFKGEATYFQDKDNFDTSGVLSMVLQADYSFKNSSYVNVAVLLNTAGIDEPIDLATNGNVLASFSNVTAKSLFPTKYSYMVSYMYTISPLWNVNVSALYGTGMNIGFVSPAISYSAKQNLDLTLVGQVFGLEVNDEFRSAGNSLFFRIKYSF